MIDGPDRLKEPRQLPQPSRCTVAESSYDNDGNPTALTSAAGNPNPKPGSYSFVYDSVSGWT
jgi:hypothetical protein